MSSPWTEADIPDQTGRTALVTGATSGLGLVSAEMLARAGARVVLAGRSPTGLAAARERVTVAASGAEPEEVTLDLSDLDSVRRAADEVGERHSRLDLLMANAGIMAVPLARTAQGFESQLGVNHLGHFALTGLLLPSLLAAPASRVVTTTSGFHRGGRMRWHDLQAHDSYRAWPAYAQSKLANLLFSNELARRSADAGTELVSVAAHPGYAATHLQERGPQQRGRALMGRAMAFGNRYLAQSAEDGALPLLYAATMPDVRGGELFGPSGPTEMRGHPVRVTASKRAQDTDDAARLWRVSERSTGVTYRWPDRPPRRGRGSSG